MAKSITEAAVEYAGVRAVEGVAKTQAISSVFEPAISSITKIVEDREKATSEFIDNLPENYDLELVPDKSKARLSSWLKEQKSDYADYAKTAGRYSNRTNSPEYIEAVEAMEGIKSGMSKVYEDMQRARELRKFEIENWDSVTSLTESERTQRSNFAENDFEFEFTLDGAYYQNPYAKEDGILQEKIRGKNLKKSGTLNLEVGDLVVQAQTNSYKNGKSGVSRNIVEIDNRNAYVKVFSDKNIAKQVAFLGMPGDALGATRFIDHYVAEQAILGAKGFENIKVVGGEDGTFDEGDYFENKDLVNTKIKELQNDADLDLSKQMTSFFTDMSMLEYDKGITEFNKPRATSTTTSTFKPDFEDFAAKVLTGQPTPLSIVSNRQADAYSYVIKKGDKYYFSNRLGVVPDASKAMTEKEFKTVAGFSESYDLNRKQKTSSLGNYKLRKNVSRQRDFDDDDNDGTPNVMDPDYVRP